MVHRSKGVPTLSSMNEPLIPARIRQAKEKSNNDSKADERGKNNFLVFCYCLHLVSVNTLVCTFCFVLNALKMFDFTAR